MYNPAFSVYNAHFSYTTLSPYTALHLQCFHLSKLPHKKQVKIEYKYHPTHGDVFAVVEPADLGFGLSLHLAAERDLLSSEHLLVGEARDEPRLGRHKHLAAALLLPLLVLVVNRNDIMSDWLDSRPPGQVNVPIYLGLGVYMTTQLLSPHRNMLYSSGTNRNEFFRKSNFP